MNKEQFIFEIELKGGLNGEKLDRLSEIKERFNEDKIGRDDMGWLIEQVEVERKRMSHSDRLFFECVKAMQEIKFICRRAKKTYIEEKDIDDILKLLEGKV
ncbi:hypothetical protein [Bacillus paralicheniformis]|uniref:hypothetical protein n=1 Tax=Bacillus paralicheniformis TaxID=1648923 RepID=UPI00203BD1A3|nr:hypothetical protein [Bacillus paralicheniformis]MCM3425533.1 hypothetical protein [Bacillus paralicheniformis]